jgi:hypothetical protein
MKNNFGMKKLSVAVFASAVSLAHAGLLDDAWLKGTTDKAPVYYKPGETMTFTVEHGYVPPDYEGRDTMREDL